MFEKNAVEHFLIVDQRRHKNGFSHIENLWLNQSSQKLLTSTLKFNGRYRNMCAIASKAKRMKMNHDIAVYRWLISRGNKEIQNVLNRYPHLILCSAVFENINPYAADFNTSEIAINQKKIERLYKWWNFANIPVELIWSSQKYNS